MNDWYVAASSAAYEYLTKYDLKPGQIIPRYGNVTEAPTTAHSCRYCGSSLTMQAKGSRCESCGAPRVETR